MYRYDVREPLSGTVRVCFEAPSWKAASSITRRLFADRDNVRIEYREPSAGPLPPDQLRRTMRRHRVTIRDLAHRLGTSQRRVRDVRNGAGKPLDPCSARDWLEAITGTDPGAFV